MRRGLQARGSIEGQPWDFGEVSIKTVNTAAVFKSRGSEEQVRHRQGHPFAKQRRRDFSGLNPRGLRHFQVRQRQQCILERTPLGLGAASLKEFSQDDADQSEFIDIDQRINGSFFGGPRAIEKLNPDRGVSDDHVLVASVCAGAVVQRAPALRGRR